MKTVKRQQPNPEPRQAYTPWRGYRVAVFDEDLAAWVRTDYTTEAAACSLADVKHLEGAKCFVEQEDRTYQIIYPEPQEGADAPTTS